VLRGEVQTCPKYREWINRPRIVEVSRHPTEPHQVVLQLNRPPNESFLKWLERFDHWPWP
jgi:hypothetical protein